MGLVFAPAALFQLILDQAVLRQRVRHAQERFSKHHERQTFTGRQTIFAEKILDATDRAGIIPDGIDIGRSAAVDGAVLALRQRQA